MKHILYSLLVVTALAFTFVVPPLQAVDLTVTAASVIPGARAKLTTGTAGVAITAGQLVYLDSTTSTYKLADCDASATTANCIGIALTGAGAGQPIVVDLEDDDLTVGATLATTAPVYVVSGTAGGIAPVADLAAGDYPVVVLIAKSTTKAIFKIVRGTATVTAGVFHDLGDAPRLAAISSPRLPCFAIRSESEIALAA